ncbi:hypothetical protein C1645_841574 [Glomus cerebriforme]|uniref:Uncharacterized protein n=1 Tax=Glomus cerebriforme TaxID=658196 RepID=A0A397S2Y2_9GLOM|nr:hypothetical protein C1645_841574 [Glomus cerebriforme]
MSTRIPSIGTGPGSQWRPHPYANNFNNGQYSPESTRQWYPYGSGNPLMASPSTPQGQEHGSTQYPQNAGYPERTSSTSPAVPIYSTHPSTRNHNVHPQAHLEEYDTTSYNLINGQSQGQQGGVQGVVVSGGPAVSSYNLSPTEFKNSSTAGFYAIPQNAGYFGHHQQRPTPPPSTYDVNRSNTNSPNFYNTHVKTEDNNASNGNGYIRPGQGLYNLVSAADVVGGSPAQGSPLIGQKRGFVGDDDNDDYNTGNNSTPSPPLAMHPPPPLSSIAVSTTMNVAAGSFPSPMHASPNSSPGNSAFSGWNHSGKRVKYEQFPEATTPSSSHSSPRISTTGGYQLPGLGAGPATPGANPSTPGYTNSNLQMVTNAQSPHHYSSAANNNGGPATGTTTPTTDGLDRYFDQSTVLHTPSPESVGTPVEESTGMGGRRYDQYRPREDPPATEELAAGK